jgi:low affinity Fe/Cu permease
MVALLLLWALSGPLLGFSDTWQPMVNTATTVITFLMVFVIQHTQNRDTLAIQIKLAELILAAKGAENELAAAEERSEDYLEQLHEWIVAGDGLGVHALGAATAPNGKQRANSKGKSGGRSSPRNPATTS